MDESLWGVAARALYLIAIIGRFQVRFYKTICARALVSRFADV